MNVIIVAKFLKAPKKIMLRDPRTIGACSAALLLLLGLGAFGGFLISGADTRALQEIQVLRTQITEQQDDLDAARGEAQRELNAMSVKLAELQAQSNRLNALGVRLTRIGRLEDGEFNFDEVPAVARPPSSASARQGRDARPTAAGGLRRGCARRRRVLGMRHFDVQLIGGMVLHQGKIAEMRTGEGKTLVATLPCLSERAPGKGVHVVTVNDYLAKRDADWMGRSTTSSA
jgi:hypothetical protein